MATEDLDVAELVETIVSLGRDIEESGKVFIDFIDEAVGQNVLNFDCSYKIK